MVATNRMTDAELVSEIKRHVIALQGYAEVLQNRSEHKVLGDAITRHTSNMLILVRDEKW